MLCYKVHAHKVLRNDFARPGSQKEINYAYISRIEYALLFLIRPGYTHGGDSVQLNAWKDELPDELNLTPSNRNQALPHKLMMHLAYWWAFILLHRPFYRRACPTPPDKEIDHVKVWSPYLPLIAVVDALRVSSYATEPLKTSWI